LSCDTNHVRYIIAHALLGTNRFKSIDHQSLQNQPESPLWGTSKCMRRLPCRTVRYGRFIGLDWIGLTLSRVVVVVPDKERLAVRPRTTYVHTYRAWHPSKERQTGTNPWCEAMQCVALRCLRSAWIGLVSIRFDSIRLHLVVVRYGSTRDSTHVPHPALFALPHGAVRCDAIRTVWFVFVPENDETVRKEFR